MVQYSHRMLQLIMTIILYFLAYESLSCGFAEAKGIKR